jgi:vacuolar-type H+-ATPase subunit I/STV1
LSTTNAAPLESELRTTRERIHAGRIRLSEIDDAINQLHQERQDVLHNIEQHLSILSPIRNLPSDVLAEIFSWTLLPEGYFPSTKIAASPWVLTHVCAAWRSLAISLPALWLSVRFDKRVSLAMLQTQLARSGQRPLTIYFSSSNVEAFKSILDHSNRWHTADLWIFDWMVPLLNAAAGSLPLLRSLTYHMKDLSLPPCKPSRLLRAYVKSLRIAPPSSHYH